MKHLLKISYLITFAVIVASVSTSCGNDSELFEEPVMFQTRAMTRASIGGEGMGGDYICNSGPSTAIRTIVEGEAQVEVTFNWYPGYKSAVTCKATINYRDIDRYDRYEYTFETIKKHPVEMSCGGFAGIREYGGKQVWHIDVIGKIKVHKYDTYTGNTVSFEFDVADSYYSDELIITNKPHSSIYSNNPIIYTPVSFETTDSLTIQNQ